MKTKTFETSVGKHETLAMEARTAHGRTCSCCRKYMDEMAFALFSGREVVGWQCFECDLMEASIFYHHSDPFGKPFRLRGLSDGSWVVHERDADEYGPLDRAVADFDGVDTEKDAADYWVERIKELNRK